MVGFASEIDAMDRSDSRKVKVLAARAKGVSEK
jgi:hypothetical protein